MAEAGQQTVREAVGVFLDRDSFQNAVEDLMSAGFDRAELSRLAGEQAVEEKLGHADRRVQELEDEPSAPRAVYIGNHSLAERTGVIGGLAYIGAVVGAAPWSPPAVRSRLRSRRRRSRAAAGWRASWAATTPRRCRDSWIRAGCCSGCTCSTRRASSGRSRS